MLVVRSTTLNDAARSNDPYQPLKKKERKDAKAIQQLLRKDRSYPRSHNRRKTLTGKGRQ
jgi:hypothetical protein